MRGVIYFVGAVLIAFLIGVSVGDRPDRKAQKLSPSIVRQNVSPPASLQQEQKSGGVHEIQFRFSAERSAK